MFSFPDGVTSGTQINLDLSIGDRLTGLFPRSFGEGQVSFLGNHAEYCYYGVPLHLADGWREVLDIFPKHSLEIKLSKLCLVFLTAV